MSIIIVKFLFIKLLSGHPNGQWEKEKRHTQIISSIQHKYKTNQRKLQHNANQVLSQQPHDIAINQ